MRSRLETGEREQCANYDVVACSFLFVLRDSLLVLISCAAFRQPDTGSSSRSDTQELSELSAVEASSAKWIS